MDTVVNISEAAKANRVTPQALYFAIKHHKLRAAKKAKIWTTTLAALEEYKRSKYARREEGKSMFDNSKGIYSVNQTADLLKLKPYKVHYAIHSGKLKAERRNYNWVINIQDIAAYQDNYLNKKRQRVKC